MTPIIKKLILVALVTSLSLSISGCGYNQIASVWPAINDEYTGEYGYVMGSVGAAPAHFGTRIFFTQDLVSRTPIIMAREMGKVHFVTTCGDKANGAAYAYSFILKVPVGSYLLSSYQIKTSTGVFYIKGPLNRLPISTTFNVEPNQITYIGRFTGILKLKEGSWQVSSDNVDKLYVALSDKLDDDLEMVKHLSEARYGHMAEPFPENTPINKQIVMSVMSAMLKLEEETEQLGDNTQCSKKKLELKIKKIKAD